MPTSANPTPRSATNESAPLLRSFLCPPQIAALAQAVWLRAFLIFVLAVLVRAPSLSGELLWDDEFLARDSPFIKSPLLALEVFRHHLFPDSFSGHYRPVQNLSFIADYFFWHSNTFGFHLTNLLLHAGSAVALFFLLQRLLRPNPATPWSSANAGFLSALAFFVALLWAVHPVHSAAVDYISGRADSLAFLFAATAWIMVFRAREARDRLRRYLALAGAAALGLLALCSRETACVWMAIFLLHTFAFSPQLPRRGKALSGAVCLALLAIYGGLRQLPDARSGPGPSHDWDAPTRTVLALRALGDYGRLMILPANLHMERTVVNSDNYSNARSWRNSVATEYLSVAGLSLLGLLAAGCDWRGNGKPLRVFGASWFLLAYLPISNLVELNATVAEHWLYLPSAGLLLFLAGCALDLPPRFRTSLAAIACLAVAGLGARSAVRSSDWTTAEIFYQRTIAAGGDSMRVATNLADIYARRGETAKAEAILRRLLVSIPDFPVARNSLARLLFEQGRKEEAGKLFAASAGQSVETKKSYPRTWVAALNHAHLLHATGQPGEATRVLQKAQADYPEIWEIVSLRSEFIRQSHGPAAALPLVQEFSRTHWWHYGAALALGRLQTAAGDTEAAVRALRHASRLDVNEVEALNLIAHIRIRQDRLADAYAAQKRAVTRQPDAPRQYALLSDILGKMGRTDAAKDAIAEVIRLEAIGRRAPLLAN